MTETERGEYLFERVMDLVRIAMACVADIERLIEKKEM